MGGGCEVEATKAISAFESVADERGLGKAWALLGLVHLLRAHFGDAEDAWKKAAGMHAVLVTGGTSWRACPGCRWWSGRVRRTLTMACVVAATCSSEPEATRRSWQAR